MSKTQSDDPTPSAARLGEWLRQLRQARNLALREVAEATSMDLAHLQKIEMGHRMPTGEQTVALGRFFGISPKEMEARRIAEKFWRDNGENPAVNEAVLMIQEAAPAYLVNKSVNKRGKGSE